MFAAKNELLTRPSGGYRIPRSLRFRSSASAFLSRTPASAGNRQKWTWSGWVKRGVLSTGNYLFGASTDSYNVNWDIIGFNSSNQIYVQGYATSQVYAVVTTPVYRDPSSWMHVIVAVDTTSATSTITGTSTDRIRIYINGVQVTSFATSAAPAQNINTYVDSSCAHTFGVNATYTFDGYLAEVNFIDGQALTPSSFGAYDTNGVWQPRAYTRTYGTNGFYLPFTLNNTSTFAGSFNGSSQRLSVTTPATSLINWYSSNFTLEYWINPTSFIQGANGESLVIGNMDPSSAGNYWSFGPVNGGAVKFYWYSGVANAFTTTQTIPTGQWTHLAFVKNGTALTIYINGISAATTTLSNTPQSSNALPLSIASTSSGFFTGSLSNIRIVNGTAVYTSNFTPSSSPLTAITNTSFLTLQSATVVDNSSNAYTITNTGTVTTSAATPFVANITSDASGQNNGWTSNNINYTSSGTTYDSMIDSPTNYADGGNGRGNYCVLNPISGLGGTITNGNLTYTTGTTTSPILGTFTLPTSGKWYWEITVSAVGEAMIGVQAFTNLAYSGPKTTYYRQGGASNSIYIENSVQTYNASSYTNGSVIGVAFNADSSQITWYNNNTQQGGPFSLTSLANLVPIIIQASTTGNNSGDANFGQRPFAYTPPSGFSALNTQNLPTPTIANGAQYMAATTYTGNGSTQSINNGTNTTIGTTFQPDFVWYKNRSVGASHNLFDVLRGVNQFLISNDTAAEGTASGVTSFNSNGFSVGSLSNGNGSGNSIVAWQWKGGGTGVSNTSGSITSTVSANTSAGFSVVTYTGTGANATVGHGLGATPQFIIIKERNVVRSWPIWHSSVPNMQTSYFYLDSTAAVGTGYGAFWNSLPPNSSIINLGSDPTTNESTKLFVAYCFAPVAGYSSAFSYTGNGSSDGPMVYLGFRPRWVMIKRTDTVGSWYVIDTSRATYNVVNPYLLPNASNTEATDLSWDILSNGFKLRSTYVDINASGGSYIGYAVAENPFKYSRAR